MGRRRHAGESRRRTQAGDQRDPNGIAAGCEKVHAFPMDNLDDWSRYVSAVVGRYQKQVRYWEVWNEGNGGFNDGQHTTADYAKLAAVPTPQPRRPTPGRVGLSVASFDAPYLNETIRALAKAGTPDSSTISASTPTRSPTASRTPTARFHSCG